MTLTFGSLFAGIGGMDLGLERAGMVCRWQVEIDDYCGRTLDRHWPDVFRLADVRKVTGLELASVDLVAGGFPCQPASIGGRGLGNRDPRWLWPEFARIVRTLRPRFVLVENVPGLLGRGLGDVLGDLAAAGYDAEWSCLNARDFGVRQDRERLFVLGYRGVLSDPDRRRGERPPGRAGSAEWRPARPQPQETAALESLALRSLDGIPHRVAAARAAGNAVVPQVAEWIGRRILEAA